jgi:hypothetical protein
VAPDQVNLRTLFKALGGAVGSRALESAPTERTAAEEDVVLLDAAPSKVTAIPLEVEAFVDGIQASLCLTHRAHRPIYLSFVAAAAIGHNASVKGLTERLFIQTSETDAAFITALGSGVEIIANPSSDPPTLERDAQRAVGTMRDQMERTLVSDLLNTGCATLVLDGSLLARDYDHRLVGVVKSTNHQWLDDETSLYGLEEGWRSPRFVITERSGRIRYSCYVQMVDKSAGAWNLGLIRLEAFDPDLLDPLAALALKERQGARSGDRRWDRHLASVRVTEEFLRARRPSVYDLGT